MNENSKQPEPSYRPIASCFAECEDIAFSLMASAKDNRQKHLFEKLYESFKYSDKISADSPIETYILHNIADFSKAMDEGQYDQLCYEELEYKVNKFISDIFVRNKKLLHSKRGAY